MELHASVFGIGLGEMLILAAIALVVIGPERFPEFARIVVRTIRDVRGYVDEAKQELDKELRPIKKELRQLEQYQPKRYFDDITNKPKMSPVTSADLAPYGAGDAPDIPNTVPASGSEAAPTEASAAEEPRGSVEEIDQPKTEMDYDRSPTPFPKSECDSDAAPTAEDDLEEKYRD